MPRSNIRNKEKDTITDDGSVLWSVVQGEQIQIAVTLEWLTDLTGYTITAKVAEAQNVAGDLDVAPMQEDSSLVVTTLPIIDAVVTDNTFKVVLTDDLADSWTVQPTPDDPVYGYFALQVADAGAGDAQQIFVPIRGLVEVRYNPVGSS